MVIKMYFFISRFIISLSILVTAIFFTPNFNISNWYILIISSLFVTILTYLSEIITNIYDSPIGRTITSFFSFAIIIYATQFFIPGYYISIISTLICSLIYSMFNFFIQNNAESF